MTENTNIAILSSEPCCASEYTGCPPHVKETKKEKADGLGQDSLSTLAKAKVPVCRLR